MTRARDTNGSMDTSRRRFLLGSSALAVAGLTGGAGTVAARGRGRGKGRGGGCDVLVDASGGGDATTVQGGVDLADPGDTVCVADGTYTEHVHVDKDLTLKNASGASPTIEIPADPPNYQIPESGNTWEVVLFVGPETGSSGVDVDVSGIEFDGKGQQPNDARVAAGLLLRNVAGAVTDVTVHDMAVGGKQTGGIAVYGDSEVAVWDNTVDGYERFGIVANNDGGGTPGPRVDIRGNDVTGSGDGSGTAWAPNGIQIGFGAEGSIRDNTVDQNRYSPSRQVASGIIVFESDGVVVHGNTVTESDAALTCGTWAWFRQTANNNRFMGNDVDGAIAGVHLESVAWDGISMDDPMLNNTKIVKNELTQGGTGADPATDSIGVELIAPDADPDFDPVLDNTKIINNRIEGFATDVEDGGTNTKQHANAFQP